MKTYCLSCTKHTANENSNFRKSKENRFMLLSNCTICRKKKSVFIKNQELHNFNNISNDQFEINEIIDKFLLTGDNFMPVLHLEQPEFTYSAHAVFTKN